MSEGEQIGELARKALQRAQEADLCIATAESCTGGALAALLTSVEGCSSAFDRGYVVYGDSAKEEVLEIPAAMIERHGAVSRAVVEAMAESALHRSNSAVALAISGFTGSAGPDDENGLVHFAAACRSGVLLHRERHFGDVDRDEGRWLSLRESLELLLEALPSA